MSRKFDRAKKIEEEAMSMAEAMLNDPKFTSYFIARALKPRPRIFPHAAWKLIVRGFLKLFFR